MKSMLPDEVCQLVKEIEDAESADIYLYNGPINEVGFGELTKSLCRRKSRAILILVTYGGSANSAYRIARLFHNVYDEFCVLVPSYCKSAGTLIVMGAHYLIMTDFGELGPLDVQRYKRDEIAEWRSGLMFRSALTTIKEASEDLFGHLMISIKAKSAGSVRFRLASELAARITEGVIAPITAQITPEGLGEDYQALMVAYEYGVRLADVGRLIKASNVRKLVHDYPSHDFVIDKREASELFDRIDEPSSEMYSLISALGDLALSPDGKSVMVGSLSQPEEELHEKDGSVSGDIRRANEEASMVEVGEEAGKDAGETS
jgi:hypothetical protein